MTEVDWSKASGLAILIELTSRWLTLSGFVANAWAIWYAFHTLWGWLLWQFKIS